MCEFDLKTNRTQSCVFNWVPKLNSVQHSSLDFIWSCMGNKFSFYSCDMYTYSFCLFLWIAALYNEFISAIFMSVFQKANDGCLPLCWHFIWQWNCKSSHPVKINVIFIISTTYLFIIISEQNFISHIL